MTRTGRYGAYAWLLVGIGMYLRAVATPDPITTIIVGSLCIMAAAHEFRLGARS